MNTTATWKLAGRKQSQPASGNARLYVSFALVGYDSPEEIVSLITNIGTQLYVDSHKRTQLVVAALNQED